MNQRVATVNSSASSKVYQFESLNDRATVVTWNVKSGFLPITGLYKVFSEKYPGICLIKLSLNARVDKRRQNCMVGLPLSFQPHPYRSTFSERKS